MEVGMENRGESLSLFVITRTFCIVVTVVNVFMFHVASECEAGKRYKMVVLPFRDNTSMGLGEMVPDVLRSMVTQTKYFESVERDKMYETITAVLPSNLIKVDNIKRVEGGFTADQIDIFSRLERKKIQRFCKILRADYAITGSISQFANVLRVDAEIIDVKGNKMLGFVDVEGMPEKLLTKMLKELTSKIALFCKNRNSYSDALHISGQYNQGLYTFDVAEKKIRELISDLYNSIGVRAVLMTLYLSENSKIKSLSVQQDSSPEIGEKIIGEGEEIFNLLQSSFDEEVLDVFLSTGLDPFKEVANIYINRGDTEKAIDVYRNAINVYPINLAVHYREIGKLYSRQGMGNEAIQAFQKALEIDKSNNELRLLLVGVLKKNRFPERARKHLEVCMKYARSAEEIEHLREEMNKLSLSVH